MSDDLSILLNGQTVLFNDVFDFTIDRQLDHPDLCSLILSRWSDHAGEELIGSDLQVKAGDAPVFLGEVVGIEPGFDTTGPGRLILRAFGKLHALARGTRSLSFANCTEKDIVDSIAQRHGLSVDYGSAPPDLQHTHVYQNNLSDLEFLRVRARRLGYRMLVDESTLSFRKPDLSDSGVVLAFGVGGALRRFSPRLAAAVPVGEVRVRAWSAGDAKEVVGSATAGSPLLGACRAGKLGAKLLYECDRTVGSREEADRIAAAVLFERQMGYVTGDAESDFDPRLKPGVTVQISAADRRFDGRYYVTSARHRWGHGSPRTSLRLCRDGVGDVQAAAAATPPPVANRPQPRPGPTTPVTPPPPYTFIEVRLVGEDGRPVSDVRYQLKLPDGTLQEGTLDDDGLIRVDGIDPGDCELSFPDLDQDAWAPA